MTKQQTRFLVESVTVLPDGSGRVVFRPTAGKPTRFLSFFAEAPLDVKSIEGCEVESIHGDNAMTLAGFKVAETGHPMVYWVDAADFEQAVAAYRTVGRAPTPPPAADWEWFESLPPGVKFEIPEGYTSRGVKYCRPKTNKAAGSFAEVVFDDEDGVRTIALAWLRTWKMLKDAAPAQALEPVVSHRVWFDRLPDDASFLTPAGAFTKFLALDDDRGGLLCHLASPWEGAEAAPGPDHAFVSVPYVGARWVPFGELRKWRQTSEKELSDQEWVDSRLPDAEFEIPAGALPGKLGVGHRGGYTCTIKHRSGCVSDHVVMNLTHPNQGLQAVLMVKELRTWKQVGPKPVELSDKEWFASVPYSAEFEVPEDYSVLKYKRCTLSSMRNPDATFTDVVFDGDRPGSVSLARLRTWKMLKWPTPPATASDAEWFASLPIRVELIVPPGALPEMLGTGHAGGQICRVDTKLGHENGRVTVYVMGTGKKALVPMWRLRTWVSATAAEAVSATVAKDKGELPARVYNPAKDMVIVVKDDKEYVHLTFICPIGLDTAAKQANEFDLAVKDMKKSRGMYWSYRDLAAELSRRGFVEIQHNVVRI